LSLGGLALTMPLMFATLILGSALLERILFAEPITRRSLWAMTALIASIVALQAGSGQATAAVTGDVSALVSIAAMIAAGVSGIAYAACNVVIRRTIRGTVSLSATLVLMSTSGVVGLGIVSLVRSGPAQLLSTSSADLAIMLLAGSFNAAAFFALGESLRHITVLRLNLLNSSQIAMASVGGALLFDERMTGWLIAGTALTVVGLLLIDRPQREQPSDRD
jgi:drug/metabolite transporter (DMT)-like permease